MLRRSDEVVVSVVTATRNRPQHVRTMLTSLSNQTRLPDEVIIVDASDDDLNILASDFPGLTIKFLKSIPSVCRQRNIGIERATGNWVLLCDDDITLDRNYLEVLLQFGQEHETSGAIAGRLMQLEQGKWQDQYTPRTWWGLLRCYVFQLSVWGDIAHLRPPNFMHACHERMMRFYKVRGNSFSLAGWPLITNWTSPMFTTALYSLGANLFLRDWLVKSPYDEVLDRSGIGDNFGVALGFPRNRGIQVLSVTKAYHHRAEINRLRRVTSYYRRILALHYFLKNDDRFNGGTEVWYLWSLVGNAVAFSIGGEWRMLYASVKAMILISVGRNPYVLGRRRKIRCVEPVLI